MTVNSPARTVPEEPIGLDPDEPGFYPPAVALIGVPVLYWGGPNLASPATIVSVIPELVGTYQHGDAEPPVVLLVTNTVRDSLGNTRAVQSIVRAEFSAAPTGNPGTWGWLK